MNKVIENIKNRRSVRFFSDKEINKDIIDEIISAANCAPSGANFQPWRFIVVRNEELKEKMAKHAKPLYKNVLDRLGDAVKEVRKPIDDIHKDSIYYSADTIIFVVGKQILSYAKDCPMVCQNIMLAARSFDIGSCWVEFGNMCLDNEIKEIIGIQEDEEIFGPIVLGYPSKGFPDALKKKEADVTWL